MTRQRLTRTPAPWIAAVALATSTFLPATTGAQRAQADEFVVAMDGELSQPKHLSSSIANAPPNPGRDPTREQLAASEIFGADMVFLAAAVDPEMSPEARPTEYDPEVFKQDPTYEDKPYDAEKQIEIYGGKYNIDEPRPVLEIGRPLYQEGPFREGIDVLGEKNLIFESLQVYGDWRTAVAYNDNGGDEKGVLATRLNLDVDLKLTATERIHAFFRPLDQDGDFTRLDFAGEDTPEPRLRLEAEPDTLFFEGDLGSIWAGFTGEYNTVDLPIAFGQTPFLFQNGIWVEDAFIGGAVAFPALNSPALDISNADITLFAGFEDVTTPAIKDFDGQVADDDVSVYGIATFAEALEGYFEAGYGYIDGRDRFDDLSYHSMTAAFTRRYGGWLSNSVRAIGTFGQDPDGGADQTANGFIVLVENSLITSRPLTFVPYFNGWFGFDRPVPLARNDGLLKNTGINFETDALTGFPKLDDSGQDTVGAAVGVEYLFDLDQQIVVEAAALQVLGDTGEVGRPAFDDQYAIGIRYQLPLDNQWILRADAMYGWRENDEDLAGARVEIRVKF